ncbi:MAG: hypothetical protein FJZ87_15035, partial [Chloroflexi bacterium]|nr:hypothetical protein [Chloroflexota bacterium]
MDTKFVKSAVEKRKSGMTDTHIPPIAVFVFTIVLIGAIKIAWLLDGLNMSDLFIAGTLLALTGIAAYLLFAIKVAAQWEKVIVLRLGRFKGLKGPGLFWIIPIVDSAAMWIDHRVSVTPFSAEKTLTKDTVP